MYYDNNWHVHQRLPKEKKRIRLRRKERLTWQEWFSDWYRALHSQGWTCRNRGITQDRVRLTQDEAAKMHVLYMQKDTTVIYLYPSVETVPRRGTICDGWVQSIKPIKKVIRIVRGRRPESQRGVVRLQDGMATRIIPNREVVDPEPFLVDFDWGLFEPTGRGDWQLAQDEESNGVYASYLKASPHLNSFRKYDQGQKAMAPHGCLLGKNTKELDKELQDDHLPIASGLTIEKVPAAISSGNKNTIPLDSRALFHLALEEALKRRRGGF